MSVSNKLKIRNLIREAVGVPSDIEMMTSVFTEVVKKLLYSFKSANEPLDEVEIDVKNIGESVMRSGVITIGAEKSWNMVKQSQSFDEQEWKKFPMYKNPIGIRFEIFEEGVLPAVYKSNLNIVKFCLIPAMIAEESYRTVTGRKHIEKLRITIKQ